ncbi:MAG: hypothetical protein V1928_03420 [Parcubacteria group bacterium]
MNYLNKKFVVFVFIILVLFSVAPRPVSAVVSVMEVNPAIAVKQPAFSGITSASTFKEVVQIFVEFAKEVAVETLKKHFLDMIVDQIVTWIQGGGDPKFITDFPAFFRDAIDQAGGKFLQQIGLSQLCSPFKPLLGLGFIPIPTFTTRTSCTLSKIGVNIDTFLKDFKQGNWVAWQEMVLRPQNNIYGAYVLAWDQYEIEKSAASKAAAAEAQAGKGFLSVKKCLATDPDIYAPCINSCGNATGEELAACKASCQKDACTKWGTITPGAVVGDLASKAVGSDIDWIVNAKDLAAYTAAITNAILNRIFAEGIGLLHTAISSNAGSGEGGSSAQTQCAQLSGTAVYNDCLTAMQSGADVRELQKNYLISLITQELDYQDQLFGAKQTTLIVLNESADILAQLQNCQGTTTLSLARIQQVQSSASTTVTQIAQIQSAIIALQAKQQEINAITDLSQITSIYNQIYGIINPGATLSLALAAQQETSQKREDANLYQQQLDLCIRQQQQQQ